MIDAKVIVVEEEMVASIRELVAAVEAAVKDCRTCRNMIESIELCRATNQCVDKSAYVPIDEPGEVK